MEQGRKLRGKPMNYGHLFCDKGGKTMQWRKESLFTKCCWENWTATYKRMKLEHSLTPYTKTNSKWIKGLNVRLRTVKFLGENIEQHMTQITARSFLKHLLEYENKNENKQMGSD